MKVTLFEKKYSELFVFGISYHESNVFIHYFVATLTDLLEQLMDIQADTTGPERLVREAAQGHAENVKDIVTKHPDKVSESEWQPFGQHESLKRL